MLIRLRRWYLLVVLILLLSSVLIASRISAFGQSGDAVSSATVSNSAPNVGDLIDVDINIDVTNVNSPDDALGSFTGALEWDPTVLTYNNDSGIQDGFTGFVNSSPGYIIFNGAKATGARGNSTVLTITFKVIGSRCSVLDLDYSAMAAAFTFADLLPLLTVNDDYVEVGSSACGLFLPIVIGN